MSIYKMSFEQLLNSFNLTFDDLKDLNNELLNSYRQGIDLYKIAKEESTPILTKATGDLFTTNEGEVSIVYDRELYQALNLLFSVDNGYYFKYSVADLELHGDRRNLLIFQFIRNYNILNIGNAMMQIHHNGYPLELPKRIQEEQIREFQKDLQILPFDIAGVIGNMLYNFPLFQEDPGYDEDDEIKISLDDDELPLLEQFHDAVNSKRPEYDIYLDTPKEIKEYKALKFLWNRDLSANECIMLSNYYTTAINPINEPDDEKITINFAKDILDIVDGNIEFLRFVYCLLQARKLFEENDPFNTYIQD